MSGLLDLGFGDVVQMAIMAVALYYMFVFFKGTRGAQVLAGLTLLILMLFGLSQLFSLEVLSWILRSLSVYLAIALLVIFQPEIRRALAELGRQTVFPASEERRGMVESIVHVTELLSERRIGALIAVERDIGLRTYQENGTVLAAPLVPDLLASLFYPDTPLHDGGVIIQNSQIVAAGCVFPLSQQMELNKRLGTRHRAAVGLSEETDAVIVVVSEETGTISVAYRGRLSRGLEPERLKRFLSALLLRGGSGRKSNRWARARAELGLKVDHHEGSGRADRGEDKR